MESSKNSDDAIVEKCSKLNVNAPVFEPNKPTCKVTLVEDEINKKSNLKSTMLIAPQRQNMINFPSYIYPNPIQYPMKFDYNGNGSCSFVNYPPTCIDQQSAATIPPMFMVPQKNAHMQSLSIKSEKPTPLEHNGVALYQNSSGKDHFVQTMPSSNLVPSFNPGTMPLMISQNNSPIVWHGCAPSPPVALMPSYYPTMNNVFVLQHPIYDQRVSNLKPQNKSSLKTNIRDKIFNTGDVEQDTILNQIVQKINPLDEFAFRSNNSRFFVIKSFTEDNIYQAIRFSVWCSTPSGNDSLVSAFRQARSREVPDDETTEAHVYLLFSVNGSGYFCGVAEMTSELNTHTGANIWNQKKWQAQFSIRWLYIKDVPNSYLRHIKLENNDNRSVTNCRDATEILPLEKGIDVLRIIHNLDYDTCLLNDFGSDSLKLDKG